MIQPVCTPCTPSGSLSRTTASRCLPCKVLACTCYCYQVSAIAICYLLSCCQHCTASTSQYLTSNTQPISIFCSTIACVAPAVQLLQQPQPLILVSLISSYSVCSKERGALFRCLLCLLCLLILRRGISVAQTGLIRKGRVPLSSPSSPSCALP